MKKSGNKRQLIFPTFSFKEVLAPFKEALDNLTLKSWKDVKIWYVKLPQNFLMPHNVQGSLKKNNQADFL